MHLKYIRIFKFMGAQRDWGAQNWPNARDLANINPRL